MEYRRIPATSAKKMAAAPVFRFAAAITHAKYNESKGIRPSGLFFHASNRVSIRLFRMITYLWALYE